jgi:sugar lactone lactonase YvrE
MRLCPLLLLIQLPASVSAQGPASFQRPFRTIDSIPSPESVAIGADGYWYVSSFGKPDVKGTGAVYRVDPDKGTRELYAGGLDIPCGLLFIGDTLWAADRQGVYLVSRGKVALEYPESSFPRKLHFLNDLARGPNGAMYVSDTGDSTATGHGAVFLLGPGRRPTVVAGSDTGRSLISPNGLFTGAGDTLYVVGYHTGLLSVTDGHGAWKDLASGLGSPDGIDAADRHNFYVSDNVGGDLWQVSRAGGRPIKLASGLKAPADLVVDRRRGLLVVPENDGNRLSLYRIPQAGH